LTIKITAILSLYLTMHELYPCVAAAVAGIAIVTFVCGGVLFTIVLIIIFINGSAYCVHTCIIKYSHEYNDDDDGGDDDDDEYFQTAYNIVCHKNVSREILSCITVYIAVFIVIGYLILQKYSSSVSYFYTLLVFCLWLSMFK